MASVPENHIARLDIEMQGLLTLVQERHDLEVGEVKDMAGCLAPETLQRHCRGLEMVAHDA